MEISDIFFLNKMITPKVITVIYWLGLVGTVFGGLITMFTVSFLYGLGILVFGTVAVRVYCELVTVFFRINESLLVIRDK